MKIDSVRMRNFMIFNSMDLAFSPNINLIFGENSSGKTGILKLLYSVTRSMYDLKKLKGDYTKDKIEELFVTKMCGVFKPDEDVIGRLVGRQQGSNRTEVEIEFDKQAIMKFGFGNRQTRHIDIDFDSKMDIGNNVPIFIPPKEAISMTGNFTSLYEDYHIAIDETYYDLAKLLLRPLKKGNNTAQQKSVLKSFEEIMNGNVVQKENRFYLKVRGEGEFEMSIVSEGYRKLSTISYLILSDSLNKNSVLFWDEPESNMNPKMIRHIASALVELSKMGVQIFIATHSYFVLQYFNLLASYPRANKNKTDIKFISLYKGGGTIQAEEGKQLSDIQNNAIMDEFDALYDWEQELM